VAQDELTFTNPREGKTIKTTELDVDKLRLWSASNTNLWPALGGRERAVGLCRRHAPRRAARPNRVYASKNGQTLPPLGLTVATPNPLYVQDTITPPSFHLGTTNTSSTKPAALIGDSINVLSTAWNDANSSLAMSSRIAADTTVNAAFMSASFPAMARVTAAASKISRASSRTGQAHPRLQRLDGRHVLLEDCDQLVGWIGVYSPPIRQWTFDLNFLDSTKLPPGTPEVRALIRGSGAQVRRGRRGRKLKVQSPCRRSRG